MKIVLKKSFSEIKDKRFAIYNYDAKVACRDTYVDIRGIVQKKTDKWLEDILFSHRHLSK